MPPASTILLLGGTGKTSSAITPLLLAAHHNVVVASRSGNAPAGTIGTRFDWSDPSTYPKPFEAAKDIKAAFLVAPSAAADVLTPMKEFIEVARSNGVQRFVLLSSSAIEKGGPVMGLVHEYLAELGVEWAVLRPSWFMDNFSVPSMLRFDQEKGEVYAAAGDGRLPFVSVADIAAVAYRALTDERPHNTAHLILGPEQLSYQDIANILSVVLGRDITYVRLTTPEMAAKFKDAGVPEETAGVLAFMDQLISKGTEDRMNDVFQQVVGRAPETFHNFATAAWNKR